MSDDEIIDQIEAIRVRNNKLWLGYVRIALREAPHEARQLHRAIVANDAKITELGLKLHR